MSVAPIMPPLGMSDGEFDALPEDGVRRELIDGVLHVSPSAGGLHQRVSRRLANALADHGPEQYEVLQDYEVKFSDSLRYIPDIVVLTTEAFDGGSRSRCVPYDVLLAVEIVSPSSGGMDRVLKPYHYAEAGIIYYWRVELDPRIEVHAHQLDLERSYKRTDLFVDELATEDPWFVQLDLRTLVR